MFGPYCAPAGGSLIFGSSLVMDAGMLIMLQWKIGAPFRMASPSCMMMTYVLVPDGPALQESPGNTFPLYCVFSNGMSPPGAKAGVLTVRLAPSFAGRLASASCDAPGSVAVGAPCALDGAAKPTANNDANTAADTRAIMVPVLVKVAGDA